MRYNPGIWADAPQGATHCGTDNDGLWRFYALNAGVLWDAKGQTPSLAGGINNVHERPDCYKPATQLAAEYLTEHREEVERRADELFALRVVPREDYVKIVALYTTLMEKHLAAEREKLEKEGKS